MAGVVKLDWKSIIQNYSVELHTTLCKNHKKLNFISAECEYQEWHAAIVPYVRLQIDQTTIRWVNNITCEWFPQLDLYVMELYESEIFSPRQI